ncbi:carbohydrate porin [Sphingopyxis sp. J-6]|uniref:carbohydrate porin n=1 Tax=Sphingopyxis sp. J-6 TaxID=3122054 RepID=UPI0039843947
MLTPALALAFSGAPAGDAPAPHAGGHAPHGHTHAGGEIVEDHGPILLQLTYTGEVMGNVSGGVRKGARYLDNLDIVFEADLDQLAGWTGAQLHLYGLYNNGRSIGALAGDTHGVSNIETGVSALRLYEAWIDQKIGERVSVKAGLYDLNSEFDSLDAAGLFVSSPHGIGTDFAQSGRNGPSIFPSTSLAARFQVEPAEGWAVRAAVLDGVPGDPDHPRRTAIKLGNGDGALLVGEVQAPLKDGKLLLGHWRYTAAFEPNDGGAAAKGNSGTYLRGEMPIVVHGDRRTDLFARIGTAKGRFNMFDAFASGGVKFAGWIPGREEDEFGLAVAAAFTSNSYRAAAGASASEIAIEATYRAPLTSWLTLQPSLHYIRRPSADPTIPDALVLGLRAETSFSPIGF